MRKFIENKKQELKNSFVPFLGDDNKKIWRILFRYTIFLIFLFLLSFFTIFFWFLQPGKTQRLIDFEGMSIVDAMKWLQKRDLVVSIYEKVDDDVSAFHIVSQRPEPGMLVKKNRTITLVISKGQNSSKMPNFSKKNFLNARSELYGLLSGYVTVPEIVKIEKFSPDVEEGRVISHQPAAGETIDFDDEIVFFVSRGILDKNFVAEDYTLKKYREIFIDLSRLGIAVHAKFLPAEEAIGVGKIFQQNVKPGVALTKGDSIFFVVGIKKDNASDFLKDGSSIKRLRIFSFRMPFKTLSEKADYADRFSSNEEKPKENESTDKSKIIMHTVKIYVDDALGRRLAFEGMYKVGSMVYLPYSSLGKGDMEIFINDEPFAKKSF